MPRKARPNRTDMLAQPVKTPTGGSYGAAQKLEQAQQAVPMAQQAPVGQVAPAPVDMQAAMQSAQQFQMPMGLNAPTQNPNEPLTHGMVGGPGAGPEVLMQPGPDGLLIRGISALESLGPDTDPNVRRLLDQAKVTLRQRGVQ